MNEMREQRLRLGMSQPEYAKRLGIATATVKAIEYERLEISPRMRGRMASLTEGETVEHTKAKIEKLVAEYRQKLEQELLPASNGEAGKQNIKPLFGNTLRWA